MKNKDKITYLVFWLTEIILIVTAVFFGFALVGYSTIALLLLGVAGVVALYLLIGRLHRKNPKLGSTLRKILTSLICIAAALIIAAEIPIVASARTDADPEADYLIVLGAGINGSVPSLSLVERLQAAKVYLEKYPNSTAVVSGAQGPGEDITEAQCMRQWLEAQGFASERIIMEEQATSTYSNLKHSLEKIKEDGGDPAGRVAIVSSEYHLYRAKLIANDLGAEPLGVAGRTSYPVLRFNYFLREAAAVLVEWIT